MSHRLFVLATIWPLCSLACDDSPCQDEPTSVSLSILLEAPEAASVIRAIEVELDLDAGRVFKRFPLGRAFADGRTSLVIDLDPPPTGAVAVRARTFSDTEGTEPLPYKGETVFTPTPDGCNEVELSLQAPIDGSDGGVTGRDSGVQPLDGGTPADASTSDAGPPDGGVVDSGPPCADSPDDGTIALFTFDSDLGNISFADETGAHHGEFVFLNDVQVGHPAGHEACGVGLQFRGDYIGLIKDSPDFDLDVGSVDFWVRFEDAPPAGHEGIVSRDATGTDLSGHLTFFRTCEDRLVIRLQAAGEADVYRCSERPLPTETWTHVGLAFGSPSVDLYVDGVLSTDTSTAALFGCTTVITCGGQSERGIAGNDNPWALGASISGSTEGDFQPVTTPFRGSIDSFRISSIRRTFTPR